MKISLMFYGNFRNASDRVFLQQAVERFRQIFKSVYAADNVILFQRNLGFRRDYKLMKAFEENARNDQEKSLLLRINTLAWAASQALKLEGDFVECGVWRGFCASVLTAYLDFNTLDRRFFLYDTFSGIPPEYDTENHDNPSFHEDGLFESVVERFHSYSNVEVVRGTIPQSCQNNAPNRVAFLHIDLNSSKAEIAALEFFFDRLVSGALVVFDDYGWTGYVAQQLAEDEWLKQRGHRILEIPSGQGLLIKD